MVASGPEPVMEGASRRDHRPSPVVHRLPKAMPRGLSRGRKGPIAKGPAKGPSSVVHLSSHTVQGTLQTLPAISCASNDFGVGSIIVSPKKGCIDPTPLAHYPISPIPILNPKKSCHRGSGNSPPSSIAPDQGRYRRSHR
jgi:hypothetical protein